MFNVIKTLGKRAEAYYIHLGRARARQVLLGLNDRLLEDAGFSRRLLEKGVDEWPWRLDTDIQVVAKDEEGLAAKTETAQATCAAHRLRDSLIKLDSTNQAAANVIRDSIAFSESQAIKELSAYTDKELMDIGVTRDTIREAVLFGRPGIDTPDSGSDRNAA